ncbi:MAG: hypothetical protein AAGG45_06920 [Pseudomonadota bacterium]
MSQKLLSLGILVIMVSLSSCWMLPVEESCYYKVTLNYEALGTQRALEVSSDFAGRMFEDYRADRRDIAPVSTNNITAFADVCGLPKNELRQNQLFRLGPDLYMIEEIDWEQYKEFSNSIGRPTSETTP